MFPQSVAQVFITPRMKRAAIEQATEEAVVSRTSSAVSTE